MSQIRLDRKGSFSEKDMVSLKGRALAGVNADGSWFVMHNPDGKPHSAYGFASRHIVRLFDNAGEQIAWAAGTVFGDCFEIDSAQLSEERRGEGVLERLLDSMRYHLTIITDVQQGNPEEH
ncbi:MAG: hypothetical protein ACRERY_15850 [Pseudomonas sp.]